MNKKYNSEDYFNLGIINLLKNYMQLLREQDREYHRDEVRHILTINRLIFKNEDLSQNQMQYIEEIKSKHSIK